MTLFKHTEPPKEIWKSIPGYKGLYEASNLGNIRSLDRIVKSINGTKKPMWGVTLIQFKQFGYMSVGLYKNHKVKRFRVHRLVLMTFKRMPVKDEQCNHINGVKHDNRLENLEWTDDSGNKIHRYRVLGKSPYGEKANNAKITNAQARNIKRLLLKGWTIVPISKKLGVSKHIVADIKQNKSWAKITI